MGRISASGMHSAGKPTADRRGAHREVSRSVSPEAFTRDTTVSRAMRVGSRSTPSFRFSFAPSRNASNTGIFLYVPYSSTAPKITGTK